MPGAATERDRAAIGAMGNSPRCGALSMEMNLYEITHLLCRGVDLYRSLLKSDGLALQMNCSAWGTSAFQNHPSVTSR